MARAVGGIASERDIFGGHWFLNKEGATFLPLVLTRGTGGTSMLNPLRSQRGSIVSRVHPKGRHVYNKW